MFAAIFLLLRVAWPYYFAQYYITAQSAAATRAKNKSNISEKGRGGEGHDGKTHHVGNQEEQVDYIYKFMYIQSNRNSTCTQRYVDFLQYLDFFFC